MDRKTLLAIIRFLLTRLARIEFSGAEHIPASGGVIVATNHLSRLDIPLLFINPVRPDITALVADKYKKYLLFYWLLSRAGIIYIDRSKADFSAFRAAVEALKQGVALGIAPEGTRSRTGQLLEGKSGVVLLAEKANVPIVPVGIAGTEDALLKIFTLRRPLLRARFGPAFQLTPISRQHRERDLQKNTDEIMARIAVLLPEKYRGFYADHPRVKELLAAQAS